MAPVKGLVNCQSKSVVARLNIKNHGLDVEVEWHLLVRPRDNHHGPAQAECNTQLVADACHPRGPFEVTALLDALVFRQIEDSDATRSQPIPGVLCRLPTRTRRQDR